PVRHLPSASLVFLRPPRPPRSPLFPYTTLFRSRIALRLAAVGGLALPRPLGRLLARIAPLLRLAAARARFLLLLLEQVVDEVAVDRKSTRLNSSHVKISYAVFCLKKKTHKGANG